MIKMGKSISHKWVNLYLSDAYLPLSAAWLDRIINFIKSEIENLSISPSPYS